MFFKLQKLVVVFFFFNLIYAQKGSCTTYSVNCELFGVLRESFTVHAHPQCRFTSCTCFAHKCQHEESFQWWTLRLQGQKNLERSQVSRVQVRRSWVWIRLREHQTCLQASVLLFRPVLCFCFVLLFVDGIVQKPCECFYLVCMSFCAVGTQRHDIFWSRRALESRAFPTGDWQDASWILQTGHFPTRFLLLSWQDATLLTGDFLHSPEGRSPLTECFLDSPKRHFPVSLKGDFLHSPDRIPFWSFLKGSFLVSWLDTSEPSRQ